MQEVKARKTKKKQLKDDLSLPSLPSLPSPPSSPFVAPAALPPSAAGTTQSTSVVLYDPMVTMAEQLEAQKKISEQLARMVSDIQTTLSNMPREQFAPREHYAREYAPREQFAPRDYDSLYRSPRRRSRSRERYYDAPSRRSQPTSPSEHIPIPIALDNYLKTHFVQKPSS